MATFLKMNIGSEEIELEEEHFHSDLTMVTKEEWQGFINIVKA